MAPILLLTGDSALPVRPCQAAQMMRNRVRPFLSDSSVAGIGLVRPLASSRLATSVAMPWTGIERAGNGVIRPSCGLIQSKNTKTDDQDQANAAPGTSRPANT